MNSVKTPKYLTIAEASVYFGISQYMLRKGIRNGTIPSTTIGGTYYIDIAAYQEQLDEDVKSRLRK